MSQCLLLGTLSLLAVIGGAAQTGAVSLQFEVASVKTSPPMARVTMSGGPGTKDPSLLTWHSVTLRMIIQRAYEIQFYQLSGPEWLDRDRFDIDAKIQEGTTKEQFNMMLQDLLARRFQLAAHRTQKELPVYALKITKNGPNLLEWVPPSAAVESALADRPKITTDKKGEPLFAPGVSGAASTRDGGVVRRIAGWNMEQIASLLMADTGQPVFDETGLKGKYEFSSTIFPMPSRPAVHPRLPMEVFYQPYRLGRTPAPPVWPKRHRRNSASSSNRKRG
jgi:uncharacterized protein (TIGR03435 family)